MEDNLEEWMVHDLSKARVPVAAKTVCRVLVEETCNEYRQYNSVLYIIVTFQDGSCLDGQ